MCRFSERHLTTLYLFFLAAIVFSDFIVGSTTYFFQGAASAAHHLSTVTRFFCLSFIVVYEKKGRMGKMKYKKEGRCPKLLAVFLAAALVFMALPSVAFASVSELTHDTTTPGTSLAGIYPAQEVDWQIPLAEDGEFDLEVVLNGVTADDVTTAISENTIGFSLIRNTERGYLDPEIYPFPYSGGALSEWTTQNQNDGESNAQFEILNETVVTEDDTVKLQLKVKTNCYFYNRDRSTGTYVVDYSVPHLNGGSYLDKCGYFDFIVTVGDTEVGSLDAKVVPYDSYRTVYELYDEIDELAATDTDLYVAKESMGHTTIMGIDMPYLVIADSEESVNNWLEYKELSESDPAAALEKIENGETDDLRVPIFISNVHANENGCTSGVLKFAHMLIDNETVDRKVITGFTTEGEAKLASETTERGTAVPELIADYVTRIGYIRGDETLSENYTISAPIDLEQYYTVEDDTVTISELLQDVFFVIIPTHNYEAYVQSTRAPAIGIDLNRDEANQVSNEDANLQHLINMYNPMVFVETHGRVTGMLVEPCTPPHEPNFEYDLIAEQFVELGEALGAGAIANNDQYNSFEMPYRDYLSTSEDSPSGVEWTEPWDDMTTAYGSQFPVLIGTAGITWEIPAYNDIVAERVIPYGALNEATFIKANKARLLTSQANLFKRGVENYNSNEEVGVWYVDQYDRSGMQKDLMRPVYDGEGENGNFYPEAILIPLDRDNQVNLQDAAEAIKYLTRNDVEVCFTNSPITYDGVTYPAGTAVVSMYQAKRSLAHSQLFHGTFISVWSDLFSESYAQQPYARGYDTVTVTKNADYNTIMAACDDPIDYSEALAFEATMVSSFTGPTNADVIIENVSEDSSAAVNELLAAGKNVGMITEGSEKSDFVVSYEDYLTVADKYTLKATGSCGQELNAVLISGLPKVYVAGKPSTAEAGFIYTPMYNWSLNYTFDLYAMNHMGFRLADTPEEADVIVGCSALEDAALNAVKSGTPYIGYGYSAVNNRTLPAIFGDGAAETASLDYGTDMLGYVEYPANTYVNASYINEGDDIVYEYGTSYFTKIPDGAEVIVQNAGKDPLQGCIGMFDDTLEAEFDTFNKGTVAFEYTTDDMDVALFANTLVHKQHQTDEYTFISNFIFSRVLGEEAYDVHEHTSDEWENDADSHWHVCTNCGVVYDEAAHEFGEWTVVTQATKETEGLEERVCEVCGYTESRPIPKLTDKPNKPDDTGAAATGDSNNIALYAFACIAFSGGAIAAVIIRRRRASGR